MEDKKSLKVRSSSCMTSGYHHTSATAQIKSTKKRREAQESLSLQSGNDEDMKMYNCPTCENSTVYPLRICNRLA